MSHRRDSRKKARRAAKRTGEVAPSTLTTPEKVDDVDGAPGLMVVIDCDRCGFMDLLPPDVVESIDMEAFVAGWECPNCGP